MDIKSRVYDMLKEKKNFVKDLGLAISKYNHNILKFDYDVFTNEDGYHEYLLIYYDGGARAVADCFGCSLSAIAQVAVSLIDDGSDYYDNVTPYLSLKADSNKVENLSI